MELRMDFEDNKSNPLTLALDGWTSVTKTYIVGCVFSRSESDGKLYENYSLPGVEDGVQTARLLEKVVFDVQKWNIRLCSVVTENAA